MKRQKKTTKEKILFNREAYRSHIISSEILRVARIEADKSHQAAMAAKAAYIASHKTTRLSAKQNQRG